MSLVRPSFGRLRAVLVGACASALLIIVSVGPASAYSLISDTGTHGPFSVTESHDSPGVTCGYGPEEPPNYAFMRSVKVRPPTVLATDLNPGAVDSRKVSWRFKVQRKLVPDGAWVTVASSNVQRATARDNQAAAFTPMKVLHNGHDDSLTPRYAIRALVIIKWYKPSGAAEGTVKLAPTYYLVKDPWGPHTSGADYCGSISTSG